MAISTERFIAVIAVVIAVASLCCSVYLARSDDSGQDDDMDEYERIVHCANQVREYTDMVPDVAIVLGSGLSTVVDRVEVETIVPYSKIDGFPTSTVAGHAGNFVFGKMGGTDVVIMQGRVHYYEGYDVKDVVLPIRVMHELGADTLILTNAAGSLRYENEPGTFMLITDQISLVGSPLVGKNIPQLGDRFFGMKDVYNKELTQAIKEAAEDHDIEMAEGVYVQYSGPQYESAAETNMFRIMGADAVGMSTAIEAIAAQHMGMTIAGISCLTDMATGMTDVSPSHEEVQEMTKKMSGKLAMILEEVLSRYNMADFRKRFRTWHPLGGNARGCHPVFAVQAGTQCLFGQSLQLLGLDEVVLAGPPFSLEEAIIHMPHAQEAESGKQALYVLPVHEEVRDPGFSALGLDDGVGIPAREARIGERPGVLGAQGEEQRPARHQDAPDPGHYPLDALGVRVAHAQVGEDAVEGAVGVGQVVHVADIAPDAESLLIGYPPEVFDRFAG